MPKLCFGSVNILYKFDYHIHSKFSIDSQEDVEKIILQAISKNLDEIAFTDHLDFDEFGQSIVPDEIYDKYSDQINFYKHKYINSIKIKFGIEIGLCLNSLKTIEDFVCKYDFDYIIGSIHKCNGHQLYTGSFFENKTKYYACNEYFEAVLNTIKVIKFFDVFGHLDYILRYSSYQDKKLLYSDHSEVISKILQQLIQNNQGLEINTSGYRYNLNQVHPDIDILKKYKQLGGKIITIGSDSHKKEDIGKNFQNAYESLKQADFKQVTLFENRKPIFIDF